MINVILDTDTYNEVDDMFALAYLLKYRDRFNVEAVTIAPFKHEHWKKTLADSVDASFDAACKIYDYFNLEKINIYKGSTDYLTLV